MKNLFFALVLILVSITAFSQDVITKKSGGVITCKVIEVAQESIKYKSLNFLDGPTYNLPLQDVAEIKYSNGTVEKYDYKQSLPIAAPNQTKYDSLMKISRANKTVGIASCILGPSAVFAGSVFLGLGINDSDKVDIALGSIIAVAGTILTILGPIRIIKAKELKRHAEQYRGTAFLSLPTPNLTFSKNHSPGILLSLRCNF